MNRMRGRTKRNRASIPKARRRRKGKKDNEVDDKKDQEIIAAEVTNRDGSIGREKEDGEKEEASRNSEETQEV